MATTAQTPGVVVDFVIDFELLLGAPGWIVYGVEYQTRHVVQTCPVVPGVCFTYAEQLFNLNLPPPRF